MNRSVRLSHIEHRSRANGPGTRFVIWFQGCGFGCPGCFNPETHDSAGGRLFDVEQLAAAIIADYISGKIDGLTLSGGEPLDQYGAVFELLAALYPWNIPVILFTGYNQNEISDRILKWLSALVDVAIFGRYNHKQRIASGLIGSANKTPVFYSGRYTAADLASVPVGEIIIDATGEIRLTGIDPLALAGV